MDKKEPGMFLRAHRKTVASTRRVNPAIGLGTSFAAAMALSAYGGVKLDERFDSSPWGVMGGVFLGLFYGGYEVWKLIRRSETEGE